MRPLPPPARFAGGEERARACRKKGDWRGRRHCHCHHCHRRCRRRPRTRVSEHQLPAGALSYRITARDDLTDRRRYTARLSRCTLSCDDDDDQHTPPTNRAFADSRSRNNRLAMDQGVFKQLDDSCFPPKRSPGPDAAAPAPGTEPG